MPDVQVLVSTELRDQTGRRPSVISDKPIHPGYPVTANVTADLTAALTAQVQRSILNDHEVHRLIILLNEDGTLSAR